MATEMKVIATYDALSADINVRMGHVVNINKFWTVGDLVERIGELEKLANAAPELLASLREMVADLTAHATFGLNEREVGILRRAEAAIAKAEGR